MKIKILSWINKRIRNSDRFAIPICLNYKGETSFKTTIGGLGSIAIGCALVVYLVMLLVQIANKDGSVINSMTMINSFIYDLKNYNLKDYNFMVGLYSINNDYSTLTDQSYYKIIILLMKLQIFVI